MGYPLSYWHEKQDLNQAGRLSAAKSRRPLAGFKFILSLSKDPAPALHPQSGTTRLF
jgi:hypothetical protein